MKICLLDGADLGEPFGSCRFGQKAGANGVRGEALQFAAGEALLGMGEGVFVRQIGAEECGVVGVEGDQKAKVEVPAEGVLREGGADAGAHIGGRIELEGDGA